MKKAVIALGLPFVGFLSVVPQAHADVTLYGVLDTYIGYTNASGKGAATAMQSGGLSASRIGMKGNEDLGGGLHATFDLENGIQTSTGAGADATRQFSRNAWVGLGNQYGEIRLGRQNQTQLYMLSKFDAFSGGTYGSYLNNAGTYVYRFDNMITYWSPDIFGFKVSGGISLGGQTSPHDALNAYLASVEYQHGPLYFGVNHVEQNGANGNNVTKVTFAGGSYKFGKTTAYLGYYRGNALGSNTTTSAAGKYHSVYSVSAAYNFTPSFRISGGLGWTQDSTSQHNDGGEASLGAFYALSKRTTLYGTVERLVNKHGATYAMLGNGPTTANTPTAGGGVTGAQVGIVHNF